MPHHTSCLLQILTRSARFSQTYCRRAKIPNLLPPVHISSFTTSGTCKMGTAVIYCPCVPNSETAQKTTTIAVFRRQSEC